MRTHVVQIGNSKGLRIPKLMLAQLQLDDGEVEISVEGEALVVRRARRPRAGWEAAFVAAGPQPLLDRAACTAFAPWIGRGSFDASAPSRA